ncbi:MAG: aminoglycoside phosphotransferase family protein [Chloroflexota bacterium]
MLDQFLYTIHQTYPNLAIEDASLNQDGQYNHVVIVNNALVFRFARFAESAQTLRQETSILKAIQEYITLEIPNPTYVNLDSPTPEKNFVGYSMIPGIPLWREAFEQITNEAVLNRMADQIADFLKELHSIPLQHVLSLGLVNSDGRPYWMDLYQRFQAKLFPHMSVEGQDRVVEHFMNFLDNPERFAYEPVLRHGDFGGGNLIFDEQAGQMAGVIDFGFAELGDPAIDIGGLFGFGEAFVERCVGSYPEIEEMLERVHFYQGTFALQEALYGVEHDDPEAFEDGIAEYQ